MATYTRQSSFSDGDTITAALFNDEFNQLISAFSATSGHTHDGSTAGDGGPISNLFSNALVFGTNANTDVVITFNATTNDGVLTWMEDEDYFKFSDDLLINSTEKVQFRDTGLYIYSSVDGQLDLVADTEIQIAATTIDMNGAADISGNLGVGGNLTVTGNATISGNLTFGDAASDTVAFSADVASHLLPSADATYDLGASGSEWNNLYIDGTANIDSLVADTADINGGTVDGAIIGGSSAAAITGTAITGTSFVIGSANISEAELETIDGITAGTVIASKAIITDANIDITGGRNITISGELDAATLDISGNADIDGTLEADAYTVDGTALNEYIADTVGAMVGSNTETDITVTYDDADNTLDFVVGNITGTAALATSVTVSANNSTDETVYPIFVDGATGTQGAESDTGLTYNPSTGMLTSTGVTSTFTGNITGNVTGNTSGTAATVTTAAQSNITSLGTLTALTVDNLGVNGNTITANSGALNLTPAAGSAIVLDGTINVDAGVVTGATSVTSTAFVGALTGNVTGNTSGTALTVTQAAQTAITSVGTLTALAVDNITINGNDISSTAGTDLTITPLSGQQIVLDGTIVVDAGVVTGATSITSSAFVGDITGDVTGTSSKATVTDSTANTNFPVVFHNESDGLLDDTGALRYNPSTGELLVPKLTVAGTTTTADTVTMQAANAVIFEGATADAYETTLSIVDPTADHTQYLINQGGYIPLLAASTTTAITSTPAELNILDGATVVVGEINALDIGATAIGTAVASKAVILDANKDYTGVRNLTITGELDAATLDISGAIDVAGTANLDIVDIDGAVDMASTLAVGTRVGIGVAAHASAALNITTTDQHIRFNNGAELGVIELDSDGELNIWAHGDGEPINFKSGSGVGTDVLSVSTTGAVFNESGADADFRVESDGNANMFHVDAGSNGVGIGTTGNGPTPLTINGGSSTAATIQLGNHGDNASIHAKYNLSFKADSTEAITGRGIVFDIGTHSAFYSNVAGTVFNDGGVDADFRVESNNEASMFVVNGGTDQVIITNSVDDGDSPNYKDSLVLHNSADGGSRILFSNGVTAELASIQGGIQGVGSGTDDGTLIFRTALNATASEKMRINTGGVVFNEDSLDLDFRVESNGNANMLFVDGGNDRVGIGTASPLGLLHSYSADSGGSVSANADELVLEGSGNSGLTILSGATSLGNLFFADSGDAADGYLQYDQSGRSMRFGTATAERMRIDVNGKVGINNTDPTGYYADNLVVGSDDEGGITIASSNTAHKSYLAFADGTSGSAAYRGTIAYDHNLDQLSMGTASGTSRFVMDNTGAVTMPSQPAFQVEKNASQDNIAVGSAVTVLWQTEIFDVGANFASNTFTAPVTGKYQLNAHILMQNVDTASTYYQLILNTSNRLYYDTVSSNALAADYGYQTLNNSVLADMDAGDTAIVTIVQSDGTAQSDLNETTCIFSGYLVA